MTTDDSSAINFTAIGEIDIAPTEKRSEAWMDALGGYHPAVGRTDRGTAELTISFDDEFLETASSRALKIFSRAAGQVRSLRVITTEDYDAEIDATNHAREDDDDLMSTAEVAHALGVVRQRIPQIAHHLNGRPFGNTMAFRVGDVRAYGRSQGIEDIDKRVVEARTPRTRLIV